MNKFFKTLTFPVKLVLIGLIPLLFLLYFAGQILYERNQRIKTVNEVIGKINISMSTMELAQAMHLERRLSFSYLIGKSTLPELVAQFSKTDDSLRELEKTSGSGYDDYLKYSLLDQVKAFRKKIIVKAVSADAALNFYSTALFRIHAGSSVSVGSLPFLQSVSKDLQGQQIMAQVLNHFGGLRAQIYFTSIKPTTTEQDFNSIQRDYDLTLSYWNEFLVKSSPESVKAFTALTQSPESLYMNQVLPLVTTEHRYPDRFNPEEWWKNSENIADKLRRIENNLILQTRQKIVNIQQEEATGLMWNIVVLALIILLVIVLISFSIRNIASLLNEIRDGAEKISRGDLNFRLQVHTDDAIGGLTKSIKAIKANTAALAQAADSIGKGDFSVAITPRSSEDILGNAIVKMKDDLQEFSRESAEKIWVQTGLSMINDSVRGDRSLNELSFSVMNCLVPYLEAQVGALYNNSTNQRLLFTAGYAIGAAENVPQEITIGETLIGQAARQMKAIYLDSIPEDFVKISTAIGEAAPRYIAVVPLIHNDVVEGVMEIGSFTPFSEAARKLVDQATVNIAIALQAAKSRERLQELFEETQAQSEELQAQHGEMENINSQLEAQTQSLQASEEELRVQQEELQQANQELEERSRLLEEKNQLIVDRNLEIQRKAEELELSSKYKSEFLANMSHELRTPLNSILLLSRLLSENNDSNLNADQVESAKVIQSSGKGLLVLIDEILDLSKIEAGKMDLDYSHVSIDDIARNMRSLFSPIAKDKNLELLIETDPLLQKQIFTDQLRVEQILKNLISNALKFTSKGSVKLSITQHPENEKLLAFKVTDTGLGISEDKQALVFEAFQQADGSTKRKFGGTGLGLSISRELARLLGGDIHLKSTLDKGSEFTAIIPKAKSESTNAPLELKPAVEAPSRTEAPKAAVPVRYHSSVIPADIPDDRNEITTEDQVVLIVEDDTNFAKSLLDFTRKSGYKGIISVRGDLATEMALEYKPVAILLDIQLPVKDGWEVMEELKSNPKLRHIPVHIMSSMHAKKESLTKGAVDFINKPFAIEQMQQVFQKLQSALTSGPKKVLIVEENPQHAKALAYFLETFSINAEIKGSINEGVSALQGAEANCVILDMGIPDKNAYETLDTIKKNPGLENLPIIIFTGKNLSKGEENRIKQYADSIVVKTAHSYQRILDEVALFLHLIEEKKSTPTNTKGNLGALTDVLREKTVLIADDDVRNIFSLTRSLEQHQMKVVSAMDGKEALKQLEEHPEIDAVLMDMMMPEMDGYESIARIRKQYKYKSLPILAVTAKAMLGDREKCIQAGASDYISKPVDIDQLVSLLRVWLYDKTA
ncbi:MAG: histidine kinase [Sphingobacteriaceae bacterium]|jgi:signal transduction histidine kinase/DNA-binding response OmpR family regulator|nr:histidine kinase [Sphingobacteriaceae bacterium]